MPNEHKQRTVAVFVNIDSCYSVDIDTCRCLQWTSYKHARPRCEVHIGWSTNVPAYKHQSTDIISILYSNDNSVSRKKITKYKHDKMLTFSSQLQMQLILFKKSWLISPLIVTCLDSPLAVLYDSQNAINHCMVLFTLVHALFLAWFKPDKPSC